MADKRATVVLDNSGQSVGSPCPTGDPAWELIMPDAVMAYEQSRCSEPQQTTDSTRLTTQDLAVGLSEVHNLVCSSPRKLALGGLSRVLDQVTISMHDSVL